VTIYAGVLNFQPERERAARPRHPLSAGLARLDFTKLSRNRHPAVTSARQIQSHGGIRFSNQITNPAISGWLAQFRASL